METENKHSSKTLAGYLFLRTLGKGTFARVKLARHILTGQQVAIKILDKQLIKDVGDYERVSRQIHIMKLLNHPSIIRLYEIIETAKQLFLVLEYYPNGELFTLIETSGRLSEEKACRYFHQFINGIQYLHQIRIVHRDLKPQNLMLDFNDQLKIVDFGLSCTYKPQELLKTACGSPCYAAPEMIRNDQYKGLMVDIWSAGVILFAMVCGYLPFEDPSTRKLYNKILKGHFEIPQNIGLSRHCVHLLQQILNTSPQSRIDILQIRKHPWCKLIDSTPPPGIVSGLHRIPVDRAVLKMCLDFGQDIQLLQKSLQMNKHNQSTTVYYLLLRKLIREGGSSLADLGNPLFDRSLLELGRRQKVGQRLQQEQRERSPKQKKKKKSLSLAKQVIFKHFNIKDYSFSKQNNKIRQPKELQLQERMRSVFKDTYGASFWKRKSILKESKRDQSVRRR